MFEPLDSKTAVSRALGHLEVANYILDQLINELAGIHDSDHMAQDMALCRCKAHINSLVLRMEWLATATSSAKSRVKLLDPLVVFVTRAEKLRAILSGILPNLTGSREVSADLPSTPAVELVMHANKSFRQLKENFEGIRRYMNVLDSVQVNAACARLRGEVRALSGDGRQDSAGSTGSGTKLTGTDS